MFDKMVLVILTWLQGSQVESAFSSMDEVIDDKSARTNIKTYSAIQSVKYRLKAEEMQVTTEEQLIIFMILSTLFW